MLIKKTIIILITTTLLSSCTIKNVANKNSFKQIVYTTELKNDSLAISTYEYLHNPKNIWPEINNAAKLAGFKKITIHRFANKLVMILEIPDNADKRKMDSIYATYSPRLKEWAKITSRLQQTPAGAENGAIWVEMKEIYHFENSLRK